MSKPNPAEPVKLVFSIFATEAARLNETIEILSSAYGQPDFISAVIPFDYTNYYSAEMGENLVRRFLAMEKLIRPEELPDIKLATNEIEDKSALDSRRQVNIDPGYISKAHLILATGKSLHSPSLFTGWDLCRFDVSLSGEKILLSALDLSGLCG